MRVTPGERAKRVRPGAYSVKLMKRGMADFTCSICFTASP
jgi:hypothetical protein